MCRSRGATAADPQQRLEEQRQYEVSLKSEAQLQAESAAHAKAEARTARIRNANSSAAAGRERQQQAEKRQQQAEKQRQAQQRALEQEEQPTLGQVLGSGRWCHRHSERPESTVSLSRKMTRIRESRCKKRILRQLEASRRHSAASASGRSRKKGRKWEGVKRSSSGGTLRLRRSVEQRRQRHAGGGTRERAERQRRANEEKAARQRRFKEERLAAATAQAEKLGLGVPQDRAGNKWERECALQDLEGRSMPVENMAASEAAERAAARVAAKEEVSRASKWAAAAVAAERLAAISYGSSRRKQMPPRSQSPRSKRPGLARSR